MKLNLLPVVAAVALLACWAAAPAASQGVKTAGAPASDEAKKDDAAPKKKAAAKPSKAKKKKAAPVSKYKSRALTESTETSYRFDADGNPIGAAKKKKAAAKAKKSAETDDEAVPEKGACSEEEPCADRSADADAL